ncbi:VanZ family protein [Herbihabitans rhizosphaerae]|uniref:VanZ family protein n=1 Tax=Herbihabitans rhizosphaerae TaxID=1872711 RepID=UPI0013EE9394|nr:VanZ family protein [Herbihabitans rhizosphaerae]
MVDTILDQPGVLPTLIGSSIALGLVAWFAAGTFGWSRGAALLAAFGLALALSVSLGRFGVNPDHPRIQEAGCRTNSFALQGDAQRLNFAMLVPFSFFGALATRRSWPVLSVSALLSLTIEITQNLTGVGVCETQDVLHNSVGAVLGVMNALLLRTMLDLHRKGMRYGKHAAGPGRAPFRPWTVPARTVANRLSTVDVLRPAPISSLTMIDQVVTTGGADGRATDGVAALGRRSRGGRRRGDRAGARAA